MTLYFAYGANMDIAAMQRRAPGAKALGRARLPRHRFVIMAEGYASVVRDPRFVVHGLLWELALADIRTLDRFEGVERGLYVKLNQPVVPEDGGMAARRAPLYVGQGRGAAGGTARNTARPGYLEDVLAAAAAIGLPAAYLKEIAALAGKPRQDARRKSGCETEREVMRPAFPIPGQAGPIPGVRARFARPDAVAAPDFDADFGDSSSR